MTEEFVTGCCKVLDGARSVLLEEGEADCAFPACVHAPDCPIAEKIREILQAES